MHTCIKKILDYKGVWRFNVVILLNLKIIWYLEIIIDDLFGRGGATWSKHANKESRHPHTHLLAVQRSATRFWSRKEIRSVNIWLISKGNSIVRFDPDRYPAETAHTEAPLLISSCLAVLRHAATSTSAEADLQWPEVEPQAGLGRNKKSIASFRQTCRTGIYGHAWGSIESAGFNLGSRHQHAGASRGGGVWWTMPDTFLSTSERGNSERFLRS